MLGSTDSTLSWDLQYGPWLRAITKRIEKFKDGIDSRSERNRTSAFVKPADFNVEDFQLHYIRCSGSLIRAEKSWRCFRPLLTDQPFSFGAN